MSEIRAGTTGTTALTQTGDTTGVLNLTASGNVSLTPDSGLTKINGTGGMSIPTGTTAQRPASPDNGMFRFNSTTNAVEVYNGVWQTLVGQGYTIEYLIIAGGGAGGIDQGGGGGAGGVLTGSTIASASQSYPIVVGAGGTSIASQVFVSGNNSTGFNLTAIGGGGGAGISYSSRTGATGGSGGGGSSAWSSGVQGLGGSGTAGQGYAGGAGSTGGSNSSGGGGGGAGGIGASAVGNAAGAGGVGIANPFSGSTVGQLVSGTYYVAGGGGGGTYQGTRAAGGNGGGGSGGGPSTSFDGGSGTANTGGGGGGGVGTSSGTVGSGGSGAVVLRYLGSQRGTGGTVTSSGGYTIHTFTSTGTFTA